MELYDYVTDLVRLSNTGKIIGKTRLQKTAYLLEKMKIGFEEIYNKPIEYSYYKHGPYSEELGWATTDALSVGYIKEETKSSGNYAYSIFTIGEGEENINDRNREERGKKIKIMNDYRSVALELATTFLFIKGKKENKDWNDEECWKKVKTLKPLKAKEEFIKEAKNLLTKLELL